MNTQKVYVTTSIPYVNGGAHVGHAQEFILTDTLARLHRYHGAEVVFQSGTDENALKNVLSARALGIEPREFVRKNSDAFQALEDQLAISYDTFLRTTEERHARAVHELWRSLDSEDLYEKSYSGLYCQGCEDFYLEKDLVGGLCPDHKTQPALIEEKNVFFRLSRYQKALEELIESGKLLITPASRRNEITSFIRSGLQDISLTRDAERSGGFGIPVPGDPKQVVYVWIDALVNYLSGQGYGSGDEWKEVWNEKTWKAHVIGKNVWKFHAVYWPALLLSAGLPLPNEIVIHGFLTVEGEKISKSLGNGADPAVLVEKYGVDALRNYILSDLSVFSDADFVEERLRASSDQKLANNLGNLVSRLATLCRKAEVSTIGTRAEEPGEVGTHEEVQRRLQEIWSHLSHINAEINDTEPWKLLKSGERAKVAELLRDWTQRLARLSAHLACYLPTAGERVLNAIEKGLENHQEILFKRVSV